MELTLVFIVGLAVVCWLIATFMRLIHISAPSISDFELHRRVKLGNDQAIRLLKQQQKLPLLDGLRILMATIFTAIAIIFTIELCGFVLGAVVSFILSLAPPVISKRASLQSIAQNIANKYRLSVLSAVEQYGWLELFATKRNENTDRRVDSSDELAHIIASSRSSISDKTAKRLASVMSFGDKRVVEIMTPASMVETISVDDSLGPLVLDGLHKTGHSRFPVVDGDLNHVVGMLYMHELIELRSDKTTVKDAMDKRVHFIAADNSLEQALGGFLRSHHHLFIVVNEYRETVGVISLEDVIEALLGQKIVDEFDQYGDMRTVAAKNPYRNNMPEGSKNI